MFCPINLHSTLIQPSTSTFNTTTTDKPKGFGSILATSTVTVAVGKVWPLRSVYSSPALSSLSADNADTCKPLAFCSSHNASIHGDCTAQNTHQFSHQYTTSVVEANFSASRPRRPAPLHQAIAACRPASAKPYPGVGPKRCCQAPADWRAANFASLIRLPVQLTLKKTAHYNN